MLFKWGIRFLFPTNMQIIMFIIFWEMDIGVSAQQGTMLI